MRVPIRVLARLVGIVLGIMLIGCGVPNLGSLPFQSGSPSTSNIPTKGRERGNPNAPVTITEYSDFP